VKNESVFGYNVGINLFASGRITLRNVGAALNATVGIAMGEPSLVKDCDVRCRHGKDYGLSHKEAHLVLDSPPRHSVLINQTFVTP